MPTSGAYRRFAAQELGPYYEYASGAADGVSTTTVTVGRLASSASVSDLLTDMGVIIGTATTTDQDERYVTTVSAAGVVTVDRALTLSSVWNSKTIEFHGVVKILAEWYRLTNDALKRIGTMSEITVTPTADATRHSLSSTTWLTEPQWVREVGVLYSGESREQVDPYEGRVVRGQPERLNEVLYLNHPGRTFTATDTIYARVWRPYYTLCRASGGTFGEAKTGVSTETMEAIPPIEWVGYEMLCCYAERVLGDLRGDERKLMEDRQQRWAAKATEQMTQSGGETAPRTFRPYVMRGWPSQR